jgi:CrcB protein
MIVLVVALGAALGAPARYLTDRAVQSSHDTVFPWGTMTVNVVASLVLGILTGAAGHVSAGWSALIGTGFCGALSTFSTFSYETTRLAGERERFYAIANVGFSLIAGLGAAALGWALGTSIG